MMMLELNVQNVLKGRLQTDAAVDLPEVSQALAPKVKEAVEALYASQNTPDAWTAWTKLGYDEALFAEMEHFATQVKGQYDDLVVLGIGGSALGGKALLVSLLHPYWNNLTSEQRGGLPRFHFIDNVDADQILALTEILDLNRTLVNVITKSGTTAETMSAFMFFKDRMTQQLGEAEAKKRIVLTTDAVKGTLRKMATEEGYTAFVVPDDVGGRFSVFSAVGLLPAAVCGVPIRELQRGIQDMDKACKNPNLDANPAALSALLHVLFYEKGYVNSVLMPYSARLYWVAHWYVQLWAESLGKKFNKQGQVVNLGCTAIPAVGVTDQHSQIQLYNEGGFDKVITFIEVGATDHSVTIPDAFPGNQELAYLANRTFHELLLAELAGTRTSLLKNDRPTLTIKIPTVDAYHLAQVLYFLEVQTAISGYLFGVDPFDQPGVELAKKYTHALMGKAGYEHLLEDLK